MLHGEERGGQPAEGRVAQKQEAQRRGGRVGPRRDGLGWTRPQHGGLVGLLRGRVEGAEGQQPAAKGPGEEGGVEGAALVVEGPQRAAGGGLVPQHAGGNADPRREVVRGHGVEGDALHQRLRDAKHRQCGAFRQ